jgi:hypothetical protein
MFDIACIYPSRSMIEAEEAIANGYATTILIRLTLYPQPYICNINMNMYHKNLTSQFFYLPPPPYELQRKAESLTLSSIYKSV